MRLWHKYVQNGTLQAFGHQEKQGAVVQAMFIRAGKKPYSSFGFPFKIGLNSAGAIRNLLEIDKGFFKYL